MTNEQAVKLIAELVKTAKASITEAERVADEFGVDFSWDGPSYGMGGYYSAKKPSNAEDEDKDEDVVLEWRSSDAGWHPSSQSC